MLGLQDMRRTRAEGSVGHRIEMLAREGFLESPFDRVFVDGFQCGAFAERFRRRAVQRRHVRIDDIVVPVEHHVIGVEGIAVRPFRAFDQLHGQHLAVVGPFPALREVRQRLDVLRLDLEQRRGTRQALEHADVDAAPALGLAGAVVPAFRAAADDMAHRIAIDADAVGHVAGLEDHRLLRQPFGDRRQLAGLDEFFRDPVRLVIFRQRLEFEDRIARHISDLALRREMAAVRAPPSVRKRRHAMQRPIRRPQARRTVSCGYVCSSFSLPRASGRSRWIGLLLYVFASVRLPERACLQQDPRLSSCRTGPIRFLSV